jgi:hypothetical protein
LEEDGQREQFSYINQSTEFYSFFFCLRTLLFQTTSVAAVATGTKDPVKTKVVKRPPEPASPRSSNTAKSADSGAFLSRATTAHTSLFQLFDLTGRL